jgi:hypothetical protein
MIVTELKFPFHNKMTDKTVKPKKVIKTKLLKKPEIKANFAKELDNITANELGNCASKSITEHFRGVKQSD